VHTTIQCKGRCSVGALIIRKSAAAHKVSQSTLRETAEIWRKLSDRIRTIATNMSFLEDYFAKLENIYAKYYIPDDAKYNLDEKGTMMSVAGRSKVIGKEGNSITCCLSNYQS